MGGTRGGAGTEGWDINARSKPKRVAFPAYYDTGGFGNHRETSDPKLIRWGLTPTEVLVGKAAGWITFAD